MSGARVYDARPCQLGEGVFWHPVRNQLFWFDILGQSLLSLEKGEERLWRFPELVSAAGWVERDILLIAGERDLFLLDIETEEMQALVELEAGNRATRSNDGRADPQGGFWISTMGKAAETGAGAIYRLEDPSAFEAALAANEDPSPALTLIESCIFPDVWDNVQQALEQ